VAGVREAPRSLAYGPHPAARDVLTAIDASALAHPTIHVSTGRRGLELALVPADLVRLTRATVAPLTAQ